MILPGSLMVSSRGLGSAEIISCVDEPFNFPKAACAWLKVDQLCFVVSIVGEWVCIYANPESFDEQSEFPLFVWVYHKLLKKV